MPLHRAERLIRASLLQVLFSIRSEPQLMDYNLLFRWFVGHGVDDPVRVPAVFTKNHDRLQGLLKGGIDLLVAAGHLAFQRRRPTLGEIYRIAASDGQKQKEYLARAHEVLNPAARLIFTRPASINNDTLTSYVSLLMTSGLDQWQNVSNGIQYWL